MQSLLISPKQIQGFTVREVRSFIGLYYRKAGGWILDETGPGPRWENRHLNVQLRISVKHADPYLYSEEMGVKGRNRQEIGEPAKLSGERLGP
jgi:hypothetical protein